MVYIMYFGRFDFYDLFTEMKPSYYVHSRIIPTLPIKYCLFNQTTVVHFEFWIRMTAINSEDEFHRKQLL